jgi:VWFA-related protein
VYLFLFRILFRARYAVILSALSVGAATVSAQSQAQSNAPTTAPIFRSQTNVVTLTIHATDGQGRPIDNLKRSDFIILEDGRPQRLLDFTPAFAQPAPTPAAPRPHEASAAAATTAPSPAALARPRYLMFVVDNTSTEFVNRQRGLAAIRRWISSVMQPNDMVGLAVIGEPTAIEQQFTSDRARLLAALDRFRPSAPAARTSFQSLLNELATCADLPDEAKVMCVRSAVSSFNIESRAQLISMVDNFVALIRLLGAFPGEKRVIYIGDGLLSQPGAVGSEAGAAYLGGSGFGAGTPDSYGNELFQELSHAAMRSNVTIYTLQTIGLEGSFEGEAGVRVQGANLAGISRATDDELRQRQDSMLTLAADTGGIAYQNSNDLTGLLSSAANDLEGSYYASYSPANRKFDGRFRTIRLRSARPGISLRTRKGYFARNVVPLEMEAAVVSVTPDDGSSVEPVAASVPPNGVPAGFAPLHYRVRVETQVPDSELKWRIEGKQRRDTLVIENALLAADGRVLLQKAEVTTASAGGTTGSAGPSAEHAHRQPNRVAYALDLLVPRGVYQWIVSFTEVSTGKVFVATLPVVAER